MAPHSSTLAWKIPWTEEPGRLQSMGLLRVGHDWATSLSFFTFMHWEGKGNPPQCSCLENPRDEGAWWAAVYGVAQNWTRLKWLSSSSVYICQCYFLNSSHALLPPLCPQDHPSCLNLYFLLKSIVAERTFSFAGSKECRSCKSCLSWLTFREMKNKTKVAPSHPC